MYGPQGGYMPKDTPGVEIDQYQKEKEEFSDAMDDVFSEENADKTDEEIVKLMDKKDADGQNEDGISTKDSDKSAANTSSDDDSSDLLTPGQGVATEKDDDDDTTVTTVKKNPDDVDVEPEATELKAELAKEKQKTSSWNGRITAANKKVTDLEAKVVELESKQSTAAEDSAAAKANESDNEVLGRLRDDFPELSSAFDIMQKRIDGVTKTKAKVDNSDTSPAGSAAGDTTNSDEVVVKHTDAIRKEHPDLSEMVNTGVLLTWINLQPDFIRPALETIYTSGNAESVIKMVTEFKDKTGWVSQLTKADDKGKTTNTKLASMVEVNSEGVAPTGKTVDKNDYDQAAKDAGL